MNRREFLNLATKGAIGGATMSIVSCNSEEPQEATLAPEATTAPQSEATPEEIAEAVQDDSSLPAIEWQMATSWPVALDTIFGGATTFADRLKALTGGKFVVIPRAAGELAPGLQVLDVVSQGAVQCGHTASYYYIGKSPVTAFGTALPFGLNAQQQNAWLYEGGGLAMLQQLYAAKFNVIQFPAGNTGTQMGGWFKREIATVADLQGLKMRIPGLGGETMTKLGVTVQVLAGGEIFQALDTGAIDAAEWVGPYDDEILGLHQAADFYYYPGWWEPGPSLEVQINLNEYNNLPEVYKEAVKTAAYEANMTMLARYDARNNEALQRLLDGGVQLRPYSDEILAAAQEAAFGIYDGFSSSDADFKGVYDQWKTFRERIHAWHNVAEGGFTRFINSQIG